MKLVLLIVLVFRTKLAYYDCFRKNFGTKKGLIRLYQTNAFNMCDATYFNTN